MNGVGDKGWLGWRPCVRWPPTHLLRASCAGVVHCAPAFGEDDYRVCLAGGIIAKVRGQAGATGAHRSSRQLLFRRSCPQGLFDALLLARLSLGCLTVGARCGVQGGDFPIAVDDDGRFTDKVADFQGRYVKEADKDILAAVKASRHTHARYLDVGMPVHL